MKPIRFEVLALSGVPGTFEGSGAALPVPQRARILTALLNALGEIDDMYLERNKIPSIYDSGVRYKLETSTENWRDIGSVIANKTGDCEDLASWRAAELRAAGIPAQALVKWNESNGTVIYHIVVGRNDVSRALPPDSNNPRFLRENNEIDSPYQWIEDPSAVLGMK